MGPLIALAAVLSYFFVFVQWSATRNVPWLTLLLLLCAIAFSGYGCARAWAGGPGRKISGVFSTLFSLLIAGSFAWYAFSFSYGVPDKAQTAGLGTALPDMVLVSETGESVNVRDVAEDQLILVFFRGYW